MHHFYTKLIFFKDHSYFKELLEQVKQYELIKDAKFTENVELKGTDFFKNALQQYQSVFKDKSKKKRFYLKSGNAELTNHTKKREKLAKTKRLRKENKIKFSNVVSRQNTNINSRSNRTSNVNVNTA